MEREIVANGFHHISWGTPVAQYFWLVGSSAGAFVIGSLGWGFGVRRYKPLSFFASNLALAQMCIVLVMLLFDLGQLMRFTNLLPVITGFPHLSAPVAWGALLVSSFPAGLALYSYLIYKGNERWAALVGPVVLFSAVATHWYTSITMAFNPSRHLNHTALAALLFMAGAFISGVGLLAVALKIRDRFVEAAQKTDPDIIMRLGRMILVGLVVNVFLIYSFIIHMMYGGEDEFHVLTLAWTVFRAPVIWLYIVIGLVVPLLIFASPYRRRVGAVVAASALIVIGTFGMRLGWVLISQFSQTFY